MSPEEMISRYGYLALFAGVFVEGETMVIAASFAAHQGYLDFFWVIVVAFLASIAGDEFYFFMGRFKGKTYLASRPQWQIRISKVQDLLERYHRLVVVGFRFLYGLRTVTPFALGMSKVKTLHFVLLNAAGALAWSVLMGAFGFLIGELAEAFIGDVRRHSHWILLIILLSGATMWVRRYLQRRQLRRSAKGEPKRRARERP